MLPNVDQNVTGMAEIISVFAISLSLERCLAALRRRYSRKRVPVKSFFCELREAEPAARDWALDEESSEGQNNE